MQEDMVPTSTNKKRSWEFLNVTNGMQQQCMLSHFGSQMLQQMFWCLVAPWLGWPMLNASSGPVGTSQLIFMGLGQF